jgi:hypothetical protein
MAQFKSEKNMSEVDNFQNLNEWSISFLNKQGYGALSGLEPVRVKPWSKVYKAKTQKGDYYLKQPSPYFEIEYNILKQLSLGFTGFIPKVIAHDEKLNAFLMEDAGVPLREILFKEYDLALAQAAIKKYTVIQKFATHLVDDFINIGVDDWRLAELPDGYETFFYEEEFLLNDGLTKEEIKALADLAPLVKQRCEILASFKVPESLEHGDFHDNNILVKDDLLTIADWGDAVIAHPFFSMTSFLSSAERQHHLKKTGKIYKALKQTYLKEWEEYESPERLEEAFSVAEQLNPVHFALNFYRIFLCSDKSKTEEYKGVISKALRDMLKTR